MSSRAIRSEQNGRDVYLFSAIGWGSEADQAEASSAGFDVHLTKPFQMEALLALFAKADAANRHKRPPAL